MNKPDILALADIIEKTGSVWIYSGDREPWSEMTPTGRRWIVNGLRLLAMFDRRWQHVKRGTKYTEFCRAEMQIGDVQPVDGEVMVVYRGDDGHWCVRRSGEFEDGRFVELKV